MIIFLKKYGKKFAVLNIYVYICIVFERGASH